MFTITIEYLVTSHFGQLWYSNAGTKLNQRLIQQTQGPHQLKREHNMPSDQKRDSAHQQGPVHSYSGIKYSFRAPENNSLAV